MLDASAVLAYLKQEPGAEAVARALPHAAISSVSLSEVAAALIRDGASPADARVIVEHLFLEVIDFSEALAHAAAALIPLTKPLGLGLGDRACLATGERLRRLVLTADSAWMQLRLPSVKIQLIR